MFSLLLCERESGLFFFCGLSMMLNSLSRRRRVRSSKSSGKKKKTEDKKEKKKDFSSKKKGIFLSVLKGLSGQLNLVSLSFSLFFLSFSFFCGILNTRSFFDPLRARHHLREKKRAHTTTTTTTTTTKHDDANKRSKEV